MEPELKEIIKNNTNPQCEQIDSLTREYDFFISSKQECCSNLYFFNTFVLNDHKLYNEIYLEYKNNKKKYSRDISKINFIDDKVFSYFGRDYNKARLTDINTSNKDKHSIKVYKNKNCVSGFERTLLAHNLAIILGEKSKLIIGESNAFIMIKIKDGYIMYDPQNYCTFIGEEGCKYLPSIIRLSTEDANTILHGRKKDKFKLSQLMYNTYGELGNINIPDVTYCGQHLPQTKDLEI